MDISLGMGTGETLLGGDWDSHVTTHLALRRYIEQSSAALMHWTIEVEGILYERDASEPDPITPLVEVESYQFVHAWSLGLHYNSADLQDWKDGAWNLSIGAGVSLVYAEGEQEMPGSFVEDADFGFGTYVGLALDKTVTDAFYVRAGVRSNMFESGDVIDDAGGVTYSLGVGWYY